MAQEFEQKSGVLTQSFKTKPDGTVSFIHPESGIKIIAKPGEMDFKKMKLVTVFDAGEKPSDKIS